VSASTHTHSYTSARSCDVAEHARYLQMYTISTTPPKVTAAEQKQYSAIYWQAHFPPGGVRAQTLRLTKIIPRTSS